MVRRSVIRKLGFDIVHGCQLRCIGCPNSNLHSRITFATLADFEACLRNIDVERIYLLRLFNFGEPLLHPDVPGVLSVTERQAINIMSVEISTNAQHHDFHMLAEIFKTAVLTRLIVSCDGDGTPEDYERLRPPAKWQKLMEFLAKAAECRDRYARGTELITRTVCETHDGRRRWKELLEPLGWSPHFRSWLPLPGSKFNPVPDSPVVRGLCFYLKNYTLYVDTDGTVVPCCAHPRAGVLGNLKEQLYSDILNGPQRIQFVRMMKSDRRKMPVCGKCKIRSSPLAKIENGLFGLLKVAPASLSRELLQLKGR